MKYSKHNIFSKVNGNGKHFIVNLLSGNADLLDGEETLQLEHLKEGIKVEKTFSDDLSEKGYLSDPETENKLFRKRYFDFIDNRDQDEIQLFYILNYTCNFSCTYCYQDEYVNPKNESRFEVTDAFFKYIKEEFGERRKYITVFGGEPLLSSPHQKKHITHLLEQANKANLEVCIVTNGYTLEEYIEILKCGRIREIQVTIDGTENIHNERRLLRGGGKTFERIVSGVDACLQNNLPVNLRMVIDKDNIDNLPEFAQFAIDKGWTANPLFKTQMGRNYELHHCQSTPEKLFSRISLYQKILELIQQYPHISEFYKPAYSVAKYLAQNGSLPDPLFDACPACKTEWAFDYTGKIYSCTATVGKADESLGTFYPEKKLNKTMIEQWESRDVTTIPECRECEVALACGGGCGSVAKNKNGSICSPDCRPVKELLELGFAAYFQ